MRVLVTGGAGFIGSAFCRRAAEAPESRLLILDKMGYAASREALAPVLDNPNHRLVEGDIADSGLLGPMLEAFAPDAIIHFAAETHVDRSIDDAAAFVETNLIGAWRLLEAARRYWERLAPGRRDAFRFVHISTDEVFGALGPDDPPCSEASRYDPRSPYAATKAGADHLARAWSHTYGLPVIVTNTCNNYGLFQFPEKLIPLLIAKALDGAPMPVYGHGGQIRDWLHVDDHVTALRHVLEAGRPGATYLIGARCERSNLQVAEAIADLADAARPAAGPHRALIQFVADRPGHDRRYAIDPSLIETELGWRPEIPFESGLAATFKWYCEHTDWWRAIHAGGYAGERLGLAAIENERSMRR